MIHRLGAGRGFTLAAAALVFLTASVHAQKNAPLVIGTTGTLAAGTSGGEEKAAMGTLHDFIWAETGFENKIVQEKGWKNLAQKMADGKADVGVFQGYEFAWAKKKFPKLKAIAGAVNSTFYRNIYLVVRKDDKAANLADLRGKTIGIPTTAKAYQMLVVNNLAQASAHESADKLFAKVKFYSNVEECIDDLVDDVVQVAAVNVMSLDAYKQRKPARFAKLRALMHVGPLPPTVIAVYDNKLGNATIQKFQSGLVDANKKERGRDLLIFFKLTGFAVPPETFTQVLAQTRQRFSPSSSTR